jgi:predicted N-acetyltransferase YhbS
VVITWSDSPGEHPRLRARDGRVSVSDSNAPESKRLLLFSTPGPAARRCTLVGDTTAEGQHGESRWKPGQLCAARQGTCCEMIYRRYEREDRAAVVSLLREIVDDWNGDWADRYWEWKFEQNPHGAGRVWVSDDKGRIAGCYIWNPVRIRLGEATFLGAQSVDAAVHPDYRRQGLFTELARTAMEDETTAELALVYAFPVEAAYRGQVRIGFTPRVSVIAVARPLLSTPMRRRGVDGLVVNELTEFDSRFDAFSNSRNDWELSVQRNAEYLQWRYRDHPTQEYDTLVCEADGEVCGYCVLSVEATESRLPRGYIVDLQVLPGSEPAAALLGHHALKKLRSRGARVAISWQRPSGPEREGLASLGFSTRYESIRRRVRRDRYVTQFLVLENHVETSSELLAGRGSAEPPPWSLVPGDCDYY